MALWAVVFEDVGALGFGGVGVLRVGVLRVGVLDDRDGGCTLARNATATTAVVATVISSLIPRLTHVLLSPRESLLVQLVGR